MDKMQTCYCISRPWTRFFLFFLLLHLSAMDMFYNSGQGFRYHLCAENNKVVHKRAVGKNHLCFPVIGDIGGLPYPPYTSQSQRDVAALLAKVTDQLSCKFVVGVGDNFYYTGVSNTSDPRFYLTFERTYSDMNIPWYMIAGNHDHVRNVSAQIGYSKVSKRWKFPFYYHAEVHSIPGSDKTVEIVMIDTTMLCWHKKKGGAPEPEIQMKWIKNKLSESQSEYLIVAGHHPILSAGIHGNTDCLISRLKPLLEKYKVNAYFSGHDHNLQHIKEDHSDVHYFVTGSGNFVDGRMFNKLKLPPGSLKFENGIFGGFVLLRASDRSLKVQILNSTPKELWKLKLFPRKIPGKHNSKNTTKDDTKNDKKNGTNYELLQVDSLNLTSYTNPVLTPNFYSTFYPASYQGPLIQIPPNAYYYNNWFYPNQFPAANLNLQFAQTPDIMQLERQHMDYMYPLSTPLQPIVQQYPNRQFSNMVTTGFPNSFAYMNGFYENGNNPVSNPVARAATPYNIQNKVVTNNKDGKEATYDIHEQEARDTTALNWMMKELNKTGILGNMMHKRSYNPTVETARPYRGQETPHNEERDKRSGPPSLLLKDLYKYFKSQDE